jgi:hypothetical protein
MRNFNYLKLITLLSGIIFITTFLHGQSLYVVESGKISFLSNAPLEMIKAESGALEGVIKISDRSFAFRVAMNSFEGFNGSLQRSHFNENYLESAKYPTTSFEGKIIEEIDFTKNGEFEVRGKGKFTCHGVVQERIIRCKLKISGNRITLTSEFSVFLEDHNIKVPSVVSQKIAEEITVSVKSTLIAK